MEKRSLSNLFKDFLRSLISNDVRFLLVGGHAVGYHGYVRYTGDFDIWIESTRENAERVVKAVKEFGFDVPELSVELFLIKPKVVRMGYPPMRIEILTQLSGVDFDECYPRRRIVTDQGLEIPIISLADLRKNKEAAGRGKDIGDLSELPPSEEERG